MVHLIDGKRVPLFHSTVLILCNEGDRLVGVFSLTVKAATLIFISGCGSAISSAKEGKSESLYDLVKN